MIDVSGLELLEAQQSITVPFPDLGGGAPCAIRCIVTFVRSFHIAAKNEGKRLTTCLFAFGDLKMRNARTAFARNLMGSGGFAITEIVAASDLKAAVQELTNTKPQVVVLCAADDDYLEHAETVVSDIRQSLPDAYILIAGKLDDHPADEMMYAGMNALQFLTETLSKFLL